MTRPSFPLFQSHLDVAHDLWTRLVRKGDHVVDATCGNGHDTLKLAQLALDSASGQLYALDIQPAAVKATRDLLTTHLSPELLGKITLVERCHSTFPEEINRNSVRLVVYNLGYLPGGNKELTTKRYTTLQSIQNALELLQPGGCISITAYPGHPEGATEYEIILDYLRTLDPHQWNCSQHQWINRQSRAPILLVLQHACAHPDNM